MEMTVLFEAANGNNQIMEIKNTKNAENQHSIGNGTYIVDRVFTGEKTSRQVVIEEIITSALKAEFFDRSERKML